MSTAQSPDVTVITPTFRRPGPLREALQSALGQAHVSLEALVLDDSPEGSAREAVASLGDARVQYFAADPPSGGRPARVRNRGWPTARGRFVHFLDDDDRVAEGAYAALVAALEDHPEAGVAFGQVAPFGEHPGVLRQQQRYFANATRRARLCHRVGSRQSMVANMLFKPTVLVNSACLIRRECIGPLGGYDVELDLMEDVDFYLRAIRQFGCVFVDRTVLHYRTGAPSLMHNQRDGQLVHRSYGRIFSKYQQDHGRAEFLALKVFARTALRWL